MNKSDAPSEKSGGVIFLKESDEEWCKVEKRVGMVEGEVRYDLERLF